MATASFVTDITEILTQAAEAAAGIGSLVNGFEMVSLSRRYYDLYKDQRNFYYSVFQTGAENPLVGQVGSIPFYYKDFAGRIQTVYDSVTGPLGGQSAQILPWLQRRSDMYGDAIDDFTLSHELESDKIRIASDWTNYLFRFEELWADTRQDDRWAKRITAHNIGIKQGTAVSSSLNSSVTQYQQHLADMSSQFATYGNGIARYAGYKRGLADTEDVFTSGTRLYTGAQTAPVVDNSPVRLEPLP